MLIWVLVQFEKSLAKPASGSHEVTAGERQCNSKMHQYLIPARSLS
jgi:hypothetical protein